MFCRGVCHAPTLKTMPVTGKMRPKPKQKLLTVNEDAQQNQTFPKLILGLILILVLTLVLVLKTVVLMYTGTLVMALFVGVSLVIAECKSLARA